ncbi:ribosomal RNA processing protein 36 homolog [Nelusetta ayraudi]|uniref:ribosomal RNA processing protein 36 homolog n=1 Tax=Nelusetta ayraudi TaxID=303726 RepID=UPI003F723922
MMKAKEKQRQKLDTSKKRRAAESSSDEDEDSDAERNFALLAKREGANGEDCEDVDGSETGGEEEEEEEQEAEGEGDAEAAASEEDEDSDEDEGDDDDDEEEEAAGGSSEIQTREDVKKELSNMSFEDVLKLQNRVGTKVYNQVAYGGSGGGSISHGKRRKPRQNKNRPMEISAKRPVPVLRQVVTARKPMFRDPRFDDLSGEYKPEIFEKTYKFIDDIRSREKHLVQKKLKKLKTNGQRREELSFLLKRMENQERAKKNREEQRERELQFKRQQRERANQGAAPFFLKKSDKRKLQLAQKYEELKKSGKLDNFLSKKRKRNAGKDRRKMPRPDKMAA